jgi:thioredoxin reductase
VRGAEVVDKFKRELEYLDFVRLMDAVIDVRIMSNGSEPDVEQDGTTDDPTTDRPTFNGNGNKHRPGFKLSTKEGKELQAKTVIVATGAGAKALNIPGEFGFTGGGVFYSALSYAPLFADKTAVVVGNGPLALRAAAELALVATHVYLLGAGEADERSQDGMGHILDTPLGKKLASSKNVTIMKDYRPTAILGADWADRIIVRGPDGEEREVRADGIFIEQTLIPHSGMVADLVELDSRGRIKVDDRNRTNVPGLFAAGDVTDTFAEQVLVAVGEGAKAALSAYDYLLPAL